MGTPVNKTDLKSEDDAPMFFEMYPDTIIIPEPGALLNLQALSTYEPIQKMLVVSGKKSAHQSGFMEKFHIIMDDVDCDIKFFDDLLPEADIENVKLLKTFIDDLRPDLLVAAGGGSVMDAAKAAYLWHQGGGDIRDYFGANRFSSTNGTRERKKVICIPSTAGTGAEVTPYSMVVDRDDGVKKIISEKQILPSYALIDSSLCMSCDKNLTLCTALDALCHAVEGYLIPDNSGAMSFCDKWAIEAMRLIIGNLRKALDNPADRGARLNLSYAATLAGMVIRYKPTGIPHLLSYSFYDLVPHGIAVASLLPSAWIYYCEDDRVAEKTRKLAGIFGTGKTHFEIIDLFRKFAVDSGAPSKLSNIKNLGDDILKKAISMASANKMKLASLPKPIAEDNVEKTLSEIIERAR